MPVRWLVSDVFDGLATLEDGSVDLVVTSPPFLALRSYLPADHPDKEKEIGSEATPAAFIDVMLAVTAELRRVLAPHGSICIEIGDTYAGSGGAGGDYAEGGWRDGQEIFEGSAGKSRDVDYERLQPRVRSDGGRYAGGSKGHDVAASNGGFVERPGRASYGWPLAKSKALIPQLLEVALAYGINPLTGAESPAGRWRIRNVVTWARPNPPVGALGDKWRPATSDVIVACVSEKRYWDDIATRKPHKHDYRAESGRLNGDKRGEKPDGQWNTLGNWDPSTSAGAPLLDYWVIPPTGYAGSHYAVYPPELVAPLVKAMLPPKVCRTCGEPSRRITEVAYEATTVRYPDSKAVASGGHHALPLTNPVRTVTRDEWTSCGHDDYRPPVILDPFAGSGTTLAVALGHDPDALAIGIDLDERNELLARDRVGPLLWAVTG